MSKTRHSFCWRAFLRLGANRNHQFGESLGDEQASRSRLLTKLGRPEFGVRLKFKNRAGNKADPRFRKFHELFSLSVYSPTRGETTKCSPGKQTSE